MNTSATILNKTINDLQARRDLIEQELYNINNTITSIENIVLNEDKKNSRSSKDIVTVKPVVKKRRRKRNSTNRSIITENSVRDGIIELVKNPPQNFSGAAHKLDSGFFVCSHIANILGVVPNTKINKIVNKFEENGMLESRTYKNGKQYRYIKPESGTTSLSVPVSYEPNNVSSPVPGINNNNIHTRDKDVEKLLRRANAQGFDITRLGSDHIRVSNSKGELITISATGNKRYELTKISSDLQKIGMRI